MDRILLVDADDQVADWMGRALTTQGYVVDRIDGRARAAELAAGGDYALVLLDLILPGDDGLEVLEQIHRLRPDRKVFVVSRRSGTADVVTAFAHGAVDFLSKPFDARELMARVELRIGEGRPLVPGQGSSSHSLTLDHAARRVRRGGEWIRLTEREYRLLSRLDGAPPRVWSREELLAEVWGVTDEAKALAHVEIYVHKLRSKLGRDAIRTVPGLGYCVNGSTLSGEKSTPSS